MEKSLKGQIKNMMPVIFGYSVLFLIFVLYQLNVLTYFALDSNYLLVSPVGFFCYLLYLHKFKGLSGEMLTRLAVYTVIFFFLVFYMFYWSGNNGIVFASSWQCCTSYSCSGSCTCALAPPNCIGLDGYTGSCGGPGACGGGGTCGYCCSGNTCDNYPPSSTHCSNPFNVSCSSGCVPSSSCVKNTCGATCQGGDCPNTCYPPGPNSKYGTGGTCDSGTCSCDYTWACSNGNCGANCTTNADCANQCENNPGRCAGTYSCDTSGASATCLCSGSNYQCSIGKCNADCTIDANCNGYCGTGSECPTNKLISNRHCPNGAGGSCQCTGAPTVCTCSRSQCSATCDSGDLTQCTSTCPSGSPGPYYSPSCDTSGSCTCSYTNQGCTMGKCSAVCTPGNLGACTYDCNGNNQKSHTPGCSGSCQCSYSNYYCDTSGCGASCNLGDETNGGSPNYCMACGSDCSFDSPENSGYQCGCAADHTRLSCTAGGACSTGSSTCDSTYCGSTCTNGQTKSTCQGTSYCNSNCGIETPDSTQNACNCATGNGALYWNTTAIQYESGTGSCCGNGASEHRVNKTCASGICTSDPTNWGCCASTSRCVYGGNCYSNGYTADIDSDGLLEKCNATSQQWIDGDAPKYSLNGTNATTILTVNGMLIYTNWTDDYDLNISWLSTNETGAWVNYTGGTYGSPIDINLTAGQTWSNYSWKNTSIAADTVVAWVIYANDSANNVNVTAQGTFTVRIPDATFTVAMPTNYAFYTINDTSEATATNTTPRNISFNFSTIPQYWVQPCAGSDCTNSQQNASLNRPIYLIQATGDVPIGIGIRLNASLPTGLAMGANASCSGTGTTCQGTLQTIGTTYVSLVSQLNNTAGSANITLFANFTGSVAAGTKGYKILINASYSKISDDFVSFESYGLDNWKNYIYLLYDLYVNDATKYKIPSWYEWR